jgi:hypothetical protein
MSIAIQRLINPFQTGGVVDYLEQLRNVGGTISTRTLRALLDFDYWVAKHNLRQFIYLAYPLCTETFTGFETPLYRPPGFVGTVNNGFVGGDYSRVTGLLGNGVAWIDSGASVATVSSSTGGMLACSVLSGVSVDGAAMGAFDNVASNYALYPRFAVDGNLYVDHYGTGSPPISVPTAVGMSMYNRIDGTERAIYKDGELINTTVVAVGGIVPPTTIALSARKNSVTGLADLFSIGLSFSGFIIGTNTGMPTSLVGPFCRQWITMQQIIRLP